ncbi:hypothetical protein V2J94_30010 [Streptomyces sp. DSM 41524]|uniref:Uncharacterized protein n=1 Tax=Streptomyces asiaticus subsp. ignotus TaxID=3098222 RepID=A0ABU7Q487_9ACTN|nr:hypothetical protein [Streptomyces sp. DSM 41524]
MPGGLLTHDRLQRTGQRGPVEVGVADQPVQGALEHHHVPVVRDDRGGLLGDLDGRPDGVRHRARLGHRGQRVGVRLGEVVRAGAEQVAVRATRPGLIRASTSPAATVPWKT